MRKIVKFCLSFVFLVCLSVMGHCNKNGDTKEDTVESDVISSESISGQTERTDKHMLNNKDSFTEEESDALIKQIVLDALRSKYPSAVIVASDKFPPGGKGFTHSFTFQYDPAGTGVTCKQKCVVRVVDGEIEDFDFMGDPFDIRMPDGSPAPELVEYLYTDN